MIGGARERESGEKGERKKAKRKKRERNLDCANAKLIPVLVPSKRSTGHEGGRIGKLKNTGSRTTY